MQTNFLMFSPTRESNIHIYTYMYANGKLSSMLTSANSFEINEQLQLLFTHSTYMSQNKLKNYLHRPKLRTEAQGPPYRFFLSLPGVAFFCNVFFEATERLFGLKKCPRKLGLSLSFFRNHWLNLPHPLIKQGTATLHVISCYQFLKNPFEKCEVNYRNVRSLNIAISSAIKSNS